MKCAAFVLAMVGCTPVDSNSIPTSEVRADIVVQATGTGKSTVTAWLTSHKDGDPPLNFESIRLIDGDQLTVATGGIATAMEGSNLVIGFRYTAAFATAATDQRYEVTLDRGSDESAPHSFVTLPPPFTLDVPAFSRSTPTTIHWSGGSSDPVSLEVSGCADAELGPLIDTGSAVVPALAAVGTCDVTITVIRTRAGTLDSAYGQGGSIVAEQRRTTIVSTTP